AGADALRLAAAGAEAAAGDQLPVGGAALLQRAGQRPGAGAGPRLLRVHRRQISQGPLGAARRGPAGAGAGGAVAGGEGRGAGRLLAADRRAGAGRGALSRPRRAAPAAGGLGRLAVRPPSGGGAADPAAGGDADGRGGAAGEVTAGYSGISSTISRTKLREISALPASGANLRA